MAKDQIDEKKTTAANYILNFYQHVLNLTHAYSQYSNFLLELEARSSGTGECEPNDKNLILESAALARYSSRQCYIQYQSISESLKIPKEDTDKVEELYKEIKDSLIVKTEDLEKFCIELNKILVKDIMQGLLQTSQNILNNIYNDGAK